MDMITSRGNTLPDFTIRFRIPSLRLSFRLCRRFTACFFILSLGCVLLIGPGAAAGDDLRIAILGDRTGAADPVVFDRVVDEMNLLSPDIVINVGDLIEGPQPDAAAMQKEWDRVMVSMDRFRCPVYYVPGNNDIFCETSRRIYSERTGAAPEYAFDVGGIHVIVLDNSRMRSWDELSEERLAWLETDLKSAAAADHIFVFFHKPFWVESFKEAAPDRLHPLFVRYGVDRVFSGHYHHYITTEKDGIRYTMIGSSGGHVGDNPYRGEYYHYAWLTVSGTRTRLAVLKEGYAAPEDWLTLDDWMAQETIEKRLVKLKRPPLDGSGRSAVTMDVAAGSAVSTGKFRWDTDGTAWVISPVSGAFDVSERSRRYDFAALINGSRYPLPRLRLSMELEGRAYETTKLLYPVVTAAVAPAEGDIVWDGIPDEAAWNQASAVLQAFADQGGGACPTDPLTIRLIRRGDTIAVAITAETNSATDPPEPSPDPANTTENGTGSAPERDGPVFMEDCVYLVFWTGPELSDMTQIVVNARGGLLDQKGRFDKNASGRPAMDRTWNGDITWAVSRGDAGWTAEMAVSMTDLGWTDSGAVCGFNAMRYQPEKQALSVWMVPATFDPEDAGRLELAGQ